MIRSRLRRILLLATVAGVAGGCGSSPTPGSLSGQLGGRGDELAPGPGSGSGEADWLNRPNSVREAVAEAQAGVIATVEQIEDAPPIQAAEDEISPVQEITMRVREKWFGHAPDRFRIRWVGTPNGGHLEGDPPYAVGQDYALLLISRSDGPWWLPASPDSRWQIVGDKLRPLIEGPLGSQTAGESADDLKRDVKGGKK
jgi:hypothetical protein